MARWQRKGWIRKTSCKHSVSHAFLPIQSVSHSISCSPVSRYFFMNIHTLAWSKEQGRGNKNKNPLLVCLPLKPAIKKPWNPFARFSFTGDVLFLFFFLAFLFYPPHLSLSVHLCVHISIIIIILRHPRQRDCNWSACQGFSFFLFFYSFLFLPGSLVFLETIPSHQHPHEQGHHY